MSSWRREEREAGAGRQAGARETLVQCAPCPALGQQPASKLTTLVLTVNCRVLPTVSLT